MRSLVGDWLRLKRASDKPEPEGWGSEDVPKLDLKPQALNPNSSLLRALETLTAAFLFVLADFGHDLLSGRLGSRRWDGPLWATSKDTDRMPGLSTWEARAKNHVLTGFLTGSMRLSRHELLLAGSASEHRHGDHD